MPATGEIHLSRGGGGIAELRLNNPRHQNAMSSKMWTSLFHLAEAVATDGAIRAVIVLGNEKVFSSGADIEDFEAERAPGKTRDYDDRVECALRALEAVPQPTVACIAGACVGAGASIACSCDIRVAAEDSYFMVPAARLGLGYDPRGIARLVRVFGESAARELLFLADRYEARAAHAHGSVHRLARAEDVLEEGRRIAQRIAQNAPLTVAAAKATLNTLAGGYQGSEESWRLAEKADASSDYTEGQLAFRRKREPDFRGS